MDTSWSFSRGRASLGNVLGRLLNFWLLLAVGFVGITVTVIDVFSDFAPFEGKTNAVIALTSSLLLIYVVVERAEVLDDIRDRLAPGRIHFYPSREAVYSAIPEVMAAAKVGDSAEKHLLMAAFHGHAGDRIVASSPPVPAFAAFDAAMQKCIQSSGPGMWVVRVIFNITSEQRLDTVVKYLEDSADADGFEVKAFSEPQAIPHLSPLVIGADDLFLGLEDPRYYRVRKAIRLESAEAVGLAVEYFNLLWNYPGVVVLRSDRGTENANIWALRERIRGRPISPEAPSVKPNKPLQPTSDAAETD